MRIRTRLVRWLVGNNFKVHECPSCGRLCNDVYTLAWHVKECAVMTAMKKSESIPSLRLH